MKPLASRLPALRRELLIFLGFLALTVVMTWPWVLHLRDGVRDEGDAYLNAYFLWWDYHQTFHDPLNLFQATILYPHRDTLAMGENEYGIALLFFPLFALGLRPLTVYIVASFMSFPFLAYGTFRLARTLSGSQAIGWIAGIVIAFLPYRFYHLSQLQVIFAGWIPLLLEALVLFARRRSWAASSWLAVAFIMNALTCLTWFIMTMVPLFVSAIILVTHYRLWRDRTFWARAATALGFACLLLLAFLFPYLRVIRLYHFARTVADVQTYSAHPINWLTVDSTNRLWRGLGAAGLTYGMVMFPGLLPPLLAFAGLFFIAPQPDGDAQRRFSWRRIVVLMLDLTIVIAGVIGMLAAGFENFKVQIFSHTVLSAGGPARALIVLIAALVFRCLLALPQLFGVLMSGAGRSIARFRSSRHFELLSLGLVWGVLGFIGSFGQNLPLHRFLFEFLPLFSSLRVAARWAVICYVGLALLAGLGAWRVAHLGNRHWPGLKLPLVCGVLAMAILFEQRVAPLPLIHGDVDPDELALYLRGKKLSGGIVELPAGIVGTRYMLRAADHGQPLITAVNGFCPPLESEIESLTANQPIPDRFLDLLESIPASYVAVHSSLCSPSRRFALDDFLKRGLSSGRLRFIKSFGGKIANGLPQRNDLYAVIKTEPQARSEGPPPVTLASDGLEPPFSYLAPNPQGPGFFLERLYRASYGRLPKFSEFMADIQQIDQGEKLEASKREFLEVWMKRPEFKAKYDRLNAEQYINALLEQAGMSELAQREKLVYDLQTGASLRAQVLRGIIDNDVFAGREFNADFVLLHYFAYLKRDPDEPGFRFWLRGLDGSPDYNSFTEAFAASTERQLP